MSSLGLVRQRLFTNTIRIGLKLSTKPKKHSIKSLSIVELDKKSSMNMLVVDFPFLLSYLRNLEPVASFHLHSFHQNTFCSVANIRCALCAEYSMNAYSTGVQEMNQ